MDSEKFKKIEEIYHAVLDVALAERETFLAKECGDDIDLRHEIESLLSFNDKEGFVNVSPDFIAAEMFSERETAELIGKIIGHYEILSLLGKGGMGEVYLAQDLKLNRQVAIKFLPNQLIANTKRTNRFIREAQAASALNHPNILTIHEIGWSDETHFIVTEYIEGKTLRETMNTERLSLKQTFKIAIQIASGIEAAHSAGFIHRDIKPENIMLRSDELVKILDFGLAKIEKPEIFENTRQSQTQKGMILGTAAYMSPEQAKGKDIDTRTDIFSFGVVFYEMLAGKIPFEGDSSLEIIGAILHKDAESLDKFGISAEIENIVSKCLRKNKDERYQTIKDVLIDLKAAKQNLTEFTNSQRIINSNRRTAPNTDNRQALTEDEPQQITNEMLVAKPKANKLSAMILAILMISIVGYLGYRYFAIEKQIKSIAVIPFVNASGNADIEYLSDGMTEMLINSLSRIPNLNIKARSSVFRYKGQDKNVQAIGKELNVQAVLNGRVSQRGERLILSLELIDSTTENVIWSQLYDRRQIDLVSLQSEIAQDVSGKLKLTLSGLDEAKVAKTATTNSDAYQAYLKGRFHWNKRDAENINKAIDQFKSATELDPNYALAYVGLADCYLVLNEYGGMPLSETLPQARSFAERAIALDNQLAEAHASLGQLNDKLWNWNEAEQEYKKAIELNPNYATAFHWYSILLRDLGRFEESGEMIRKAHEFDPLSSIIAINISQVYQAQGKYEESVENTLKVISLDPNFASSYNSLALSYLKLGRNAEAIANFEKATALGKRSDVMLRNLGFGYAVVGKRAEALAIAKELEANYEKKKSFGQFLAAVYAGLGDKDKAFEWLEKDFQNKEDLGSLGWSIQFESLFNDPRYKDLRKRLGLPD